MAKLNSKKARKKSILLSKTFLRIDSRTYCSVDFGNLHKNDSWAKYGLRAKSGPPRPFVLPAARLFELMLVRVNVKM